MNQHFINGRYVAGQTGETLAKLNPATGEEFARIACGNAADIDAAVRAARAAFEGAWGRLTAAERGRRTRRCAFVECLGPTGSSGRAGSNLFDGKRVRLCA